ncbi:ATP-grasp domain-containing protein [Streptomyces armeniacus]|nr:ATP-grasp domain-containing protein [Streptomyces armeniacus]
MAFLRSVDIQRADPYIQQAVDELSAKGVRSGLFYTHGQAGEADFPGERLPLDPGLGARELAERVADWGADAAVSISLPCENALRDAAAGQILRAAGIPTVVSPVEVTWGLVDKWDCKQLLTHAGLDVPKGFRADSDLLHGRGLTVPGYADAIRAAAAETGFPLLSKPVWDSTSMGIRPIPDEAGLESYLSAPPPVSAVVEEVVHGDLCSVDIVGAPGAYQVLPVCWTGVAAAQPVFTFADLRWCGPRPEADAAFEPVAKKLTDLFAGLGVEGSVNVDMIHTAGTYRILEVNPRIGGATTLSCAASGTNTFRTLAALALGQEPAGAPVRTGWAIEFLVPDGVPERARAELARGLELVTLHELVIDGFSHGDIVVFTLPEGEEPRTLETLAGMRRSTGFPSADVVEKIARLLAP